MEGTGDRGGVGGGYRTTVIGTPKGVKFHITASGAPLNCGSTAKNILRKSFFHVVIPFSVRSQFTKKKYPTQSVKQSNIDECFPGLAYY